MGLRNSFLAGAGSGLAFGIFSTTGQSIDPYDILIQIGDIFNRTVTTKVNSSSFFSNYWLWLKPVIVLIGFIATLGIVYSILQEGLPGIITAIIGFLSIFLLIQYANNNNVIMLWIGFSLLIIGLILAGSDTSS